MSKRMPEMLPDPDFPEFDGVYVGDKENPVQASAFPLSHSKLKQVCAGAREKYFRINGRRV